ncbi:MAG: TonB-dependent receptor [Gammaproteobacteria bacterium]|nr:TonB-dependent receptor [Gammaproteobacteria bacterium]
MRQSPLRHSILNTGFAGLAAAALLLGGPALRAAAGPQAEAAAPAGAELDEIVVTGSRIARSGFTTPTPVTVVGQEVLEQRALTNVGELLNQLPSFRPLVTPATQQAVGGNVGARVLDLRGLGATRTLVLLDGMRFVPSTTQGTIDVNLIPSVLVKRIEVVTGGASAAYGSDAVAGVVNFILDREFTGFKLATQYGTSQRSDDREHNVSLAFGTSITDGRGHAVSAIEFNDAKGMGDCYSRDWCPREQLVGNSPAGYAGLPASMRVGPDAPGNLNQDGLINTTSGPLRGITFNPDGTIRNYQYGHIFGTNLSPLFTLGGEGTFENGYLQGILLKPPVERVSLYQHFDYAFSDRVRANLDLSYGQVKGKVVGSQARATNFLIARDNAYLPAPVATIMDANAIGSFTLGRVFGDLGGSVDRSSNETLRAVAALAGDITGSWNWDAYYQYGRNDFRQDYSGNVVMTRMRNAIDAVVNTGGQTVCRINADANPANDDPGCAPLNPFGRGNISPAARDYVAPSGYQTALTAEHVIAGNLHGDVAALPGGALSIATGLEYRSDEMHGDADAFSASNAFWSFNGKALNGRIRVTEGYVEAVAPLFRNLPLARLLELNGAARRTRYDRSSPGRSSTELAVTTWKGGIVFEPLEQIRLRATRSRDIRAPNITELFGPVTAGRTTIVDPQNAGQQIQIDALTGANPLLQPEKADTWTAGVVLSPTWQPVRTLRLSVDYFTISLEGAIATLGAQTVVNRCFAGATEFCPFVTRDGTGTLVRVQDVLQNVNRQVTRGIDIEAGYTVDAGSRGALDLRLLATRYTELSTRDSVGVTDRAGQTGYRPGTTTGVPDWIIDGSVSWTLRSATVGARARYIPEGVFDVLFRGPEDAGYNPSAPNSVSSNRVASAFYLDVNGEWRASESLTVFAAISNALDRDPPLAASAQGGTNQVYFDPVGRYYRLGLRARL